MAPLPFASLSDLNNYHNPQDNNNMVNNNFQQSTNQITQNQLNYNNQFVKNNQNYQEFLQNNQTSGTPKFQEKPNPISSPNLGGSKQIAPNVPPLNENYSKTAQRPAWTNIMNSFPTNQGINMFNRFQTPIEYLSEHDQIVTLLQEISFILKVIMILFILMFVSKLCEKK